MSNPGEKLIFLPSQKRRPILCGIAGWIGSKTRVQKCFSGKLQSIIQNVIEFQNHRGPDANGIWEDKPG